MGGGGRGSKERWGERQRGGGAEGRSLVEIRVAREMAGWRRDLLRESAWGVEVGLKGEIRWCGYKEGDLAGFKMLAGGGARVVVGGGWWRRKALGLAAWAGWVVAYAEATNIAG